MQGFNVDESKALKEELRFYNYMAYSCFKICVNSLEKETIETTDQNCLKSCYRKTLISYERMKITRNKIVEDRSITGW